MTMYSSESPTRVNEPLLKIRCCTFADLNYYTAGQLKTVKCNVIIICCDYYK